MKISSSGNAGPIRIHAIVLTRERPETLGRCVATAISSMGEQDLLTVIDDSRRSFLSANSAILTANANSGLSKAYLTATRAREVLARSLARSDRLWLAKAAPRDIAPMRNLSLILSVVVSAETTILIDDDICAFDLSATHHKTTALASSGHGLIVGANIGGVSDLDTITRLNEAITRIDKQHMSGSVSIKDLFSANGASALGTGANSKYVSAGYLSFRLLPKQIFAFPPGYNEDWLWCLLHGKESQVEVVNSGDMVIHDPPCVLRPTREDLRFELLGDLVFDCLEEQGGGDNLDPESKLSSLSNRCPDPSSMPLARVLQLSRRLTSSGNGRRDLSVVREFGLSVITDMLRTDELNMDGKEVLTSWYNDAIAKHMAFARTMDDEGTIAAIRTLLQEGRI